MKKSELIILTILIMIIAGSMMGIRANGQSKKSLGTTTAMYKEIEAEYVEGIRDELENQGYMHSGVSMTKTVNEDGSIVYVVAINNDKIDLLDEYQRKELSDIIVKDGIEVDNSCVRILF